MQDTKTTSRGNGNFTTDFCPVCHGSGYEFFEENVKIYGDIPARKVRLCTFCNGMHNQIVSERKLYAEIPLNRTIEEFDWSIYPEDMKKREFIIQKFLSEFRSFEAEGMGLYIHSRTKGSGKTLLASCIAGELINRYEASVVFVNVSDLLSISEKKDETGVDSLDRLINCRVLILDDLGQKNTGRGWLSDILFRIIDKRYIKRRTVIITSNDPKKELQFDDRITDRINAMTISLNLPEYCVRAKEADNRKRDFLRRMGIY